MRAPRGAAHSQQSGYRLNIANPGVIGVAVKESVATPLDTVAQIN